MDAHMHIESSMLSVTELARLLLPRGVTAIFADPHEIGNVHGLKGIRVMWEETQQLPLARVYLPELGRSYRLGTRDIGRHAGTG